MKRTLRWSARRWWLGLTAALLLNTVALEPTAPAMASSAKQGQAPIDDDTAPEPKAEDEFAPDDRPLSSPTATAGPDRTAVPGPDTANAASPGPLTVTYTASNATFPNPERGFYRFGPDCDDESHPFSVADAVRIPDKRPHHVGAVRLLPTQDRRTDR